MISDWKTKIATIDIVEEYKKSYSISEMLRTLGLINSTGARGHIKSILVEKGVYQGVGGLSALHKQTRIQKTMKDRYGVINAGQMPNGGWKHNDVEMNSVSFLKEFTSYCIDVDKYTKINKKRMIMSNHCYYTGITFADVMMDKVNPNDPLKKSIDHKISKWAGFMTGESPDMIGSTQNLVYCLKYCNTIKNQMCEDTFKPYAFIIREKLINEGYSSN